MSLDSATLRNYLKEIGRGKNAARDLSRDDAQQLFSAMLAGEVPDLQLGGVLIALRIKGESLDELAGFAAACESSYAHLPGLAGGAVPVVIPSYNGARALPNLVPLLALLLAREGVPVLMHGVDRDPGRVATREVLAALGIAPASSAAHALDELNAKRLSFLSIQHLAPSVNALLALRSKLGLRNSAHTLVKMLQPFTIPAVRLVSVTHPEYLVRMREYFTQHDDGALLLRGAEGEAVAHPRRTLSIDWAHGGMVQTWAADAEPPRDDLPAREADVTARWIERVLAGEIAIPRAIAHQVECCKRAVAALQKPGSDPVFGGRS